MSDELFTILWKPWPAGWHIRSLDASGHYLVELLSEYPAYHHLTSGCLFPWDKARIVELGKHILSFVDMATRPAPPSSYTGFFGLKKSTPEGNLTYFYSPNAEENAQLKSFLELVATLDPYFAPLNLMLRQRSELYSDLTDPGK
jgi:hypothetical protein